MDELLRNVRNTNAAIFQCKYRINKGNKFDYLNSNGSFKWYLIHST